MDGLLHIELKHKMCEFSISLIGVYLSPHNSPYGRDSSAFFANPISLVYSSMISDITLACGDINPRISNIDDFIASIDDIPSRQNIDTVKNTHGESLISFLLDTKICVLVTPNLYNFTSISTKGKSVVDYFLTTHHCLKFCKELAVIPMNELITNYDLQHLVSSKCRTPDHSLVSLKLNYSLNLKVCLKTKIH